MLKKDYPISGFDILFSIKVHHAYFKDELCRGLTFTPSTPTARLMQKTGLLMKKQESGFSVFYENDRLEAMKMYLDDPIDPFRFIFSGRSEDPLFFNYTQPGREQDDIMFFSSPPAGGSNRPPVAADMQNLQQTDSDPAPPGAAGILSEMPAGRPPHFIIAIHPDTNKNLLFSEQGLPLGSRFQLTFSARSTFWKYIVLGKKASAPLTIIDKNGVVTFTKTNVPMSLSNRSACAFISDRALCFCDIPTCRFELKDTSSHASLVKKLPAASPDIIFKTDLSDSSAWLSEIFINI